MNNHSFDCAWNLLPWRVQQRQEQHQRYLRFLWKTLLAALIILIIVHLILLALLHKQDVRNHSLRLTEQKLQSQVILIEKLKAQTTLLQSQVKVLQQLAVTRHLNQVGVVT